VTPFGGLLHPPEQAAQVQASAVKVSAHGPGIADAPKVAVRSAATTRVLVGGMTLAVLGATGFVALAQRAAIKHDSASRRRNLQRVNAGA